MALTANKQRNIFTSEDIFTRTLAVASSQTLYRGALVGKNAAGNAVEMQSTLTFMGVAMDYKANATTAIDTTNRIVVETGQVEYFAYSTASYTHLRKKFYAVADDTVTTVASTSNYVGFAIGYISSAGLFLRVEAGNP